MSQKAILLTVNLRYLKNARNLKSIRKKIDFFKVIVRRGHKKKAFIVCGEIAKKRIVLT